ncbi:MAG TPA: hypothetical protein PLD37_06570 [Usitatibacteraceae bacterium]|nr:hypothetical protein [Usitatibacteraceae bacterium]
MERGTLFVVGEGGEAVGEAGGEARGEIAAKRDVARRGGGRDRDELVGALVERRSSSRASTPSSASTGAFSVPV